MVSQPNHCHSGLDPESRFSPRGRLPFPFPVIPNNSASCSTRNSQSGPYAILHASVAHCHASHGNFAARSGAIALPWASGAHQYAPLFSGCDVMPCGAEDRGVPQKFSLFRQTAARAHALQGPQTVFLPESRAPWLNYRGPFTATPVVAHRKGFPVRLFGGNPFPLPRDCAGKPLIPVIQSGAGVVLFWRRCGKQI